MYRAVHGKQEKQENARERDTKERALNGSRRKRRRKRGEKVEEKAEWNGEKREAKRVVRLLQNTRG